MIAKPSRLLGKQILGVTIYAVCFLALDLNVLFAESSKALPDITASPRLVARRTSEMSSARNRFPLYFIENRGQADANAAYYIHGADKVLYFGSTGVTMVLGKPAGRRSAPTDLAGMAAAEDAVAGSISRAVVTLEFVGADPTVKPVGEDLAKARFSYFKGPRENWAAGLKSYTRLVYADLWPGIDLIYTASVGRLKYVFMVKPGADPSRIQLRYRGAESISLKRDGKLLIRTAVEDFEDERPTAHQELDGSVKNVSAEYILLSSQSDGGASYGFDLGIYDPTKLLVIDPTLLVYSGFIGGSGDDRGNGIAVDSEGNSYITGETNSLLSTFPSITGPDISHNGGFDAFVAKIDPTGSELLYAGFIGGTGDDRGKSIAVDSLGNAYITGETSSDQNSFPVTVGPDLTYNGAIDAFVAKIDAAGTNLVYAGYIGGLDLDRAMGIAVDGSNRAYVTGETASTAASFPNGAGFGGLSSFDSIQNGDLDAFVVRVAANGASFEYAGYIGGIGTDRGRSIAVDSLNRAYIAGETNSSSTSFPNGIGFAGLTSFDSSINGSSDAFVARVAADGLSLSYAGYIGGSNADKANGVVVDGTGAAYVTGETSSDANSFPGGNGLGGLPGPGQVQNGGVDAFVAKINAAGNALLYAGYIGGSAEDRGNGIALLPGCLSDCEVYIAGETSSPQATFPVLDGPDLTHNGGVDAFLAKIEADGSLGMAGFIGGTGDDRGKAIAVDVVGSVYLTGETNSTQPTFPLKGALDSTQNLGVDAFVAKFCVAVCVDLLLTQDDSPDPATVGTNVTYTVRVTNNGPDTATDVELTDVLPPGVGFVSVTSTVGACTGSSTIVCDLGDLSNGASATVTIVVSTSAAAKLTNSATVSSGESDTDPSNNVDQEQTQVTLPDLTVKSLGVVAAALPGASIVVNDTTSNRGKVAAGPSLTRFFLSTDSRFDGADIPLPGGSRAIPALAPKQNSSGSSTLTIPLATPLGRYFLIGVADADTGIPETKEKNAKARSISVALPDLIIQSLRGPKSAAAGSSFAVTETIRNNAPVGAGTSTTQYYFSTDTLLDGGDSLIGSRSVPALGAKGRNSGSSTVTIPLAAPGPYFILAVSDGANAVTEAAEGNNLRAQSITITP